VVQEKNEEKKAPKTIEEEVKL